LIKLPYEKTKFLVEYRRHLAKHNISLVAGHEPRAYTWENVDASGNGFLTNDVPDLSAGNETTSGTTGGWGEWGMES